MLGRSSQQRTAILSRPDLNSPDRAHPPHGHGSIQSELPSWAPRSPIADYDCSDDCLTRLPARLVTDTFAKSSGDRGSYDQRQIQFNFPRITEPSTTA